MERKRSTEVFVELTVNTNQRIIELLIQKIDYILVGSRSPGVWQSPFSPQFVVHEGKNLRRRIRAMYFIQENRTERISRLRKANWSLKSLRIPMAIRSRFGGTLLSLIS